MAASYADPDKMPSKPIHRAANRRWTPVQNMRVNHRRLDITMAEKFLNGADVVACLQ